MQHDVYSLGVCLLEIGMWTPFVRFDTESAVPGIPEIAAVPSMHDQRKRAFEIKRIFTDLAKEKLPSLVGDRYTEVVISCLTCLDKDGSFGSADSFVDEDGVAVGVRYIQKVNIHSSRAFTRPIR